MTPEELRALLSGKEDEHYEFKEAKTSFTLEKLYEYCIAFANELGGKLVLGVTDVIPREVVGTSAFPNREDIKQKIFDTLRFRVEVEQLTLDNTRVLVFSIPSRPLGTPLHLNGRYLMRSGESLVAMSPDQLQRIFSETRLDYSAEICPGTDLDDLDPSAMEVFRNRWHKKTNNHAILEMTDQQLLEDSELSIDGKLTFAALILLGTKKALGIHLAQSEVIMEYRGTEGQIAASQRYEFRQGFLIFHEELWNLINNRNEVVSIRDGLFRYEIPTFNEDAVREAVLNAICHRDYRMGGSVSVRQFPKRLEISSPGGLPDGITPDNILRKQSPRNRRLAEACSKCGLVERSGQGMDRIFDASLREGKGRPDFSGTDEYEVVLTMQGEVVDKQFLDLLQLAEKNNILLNAHHLVILDAIRQNEVPPPEADILVFHLINIGLVERVGRGKQNRLILSRGMYRYLGQPGTYTRYAGLDRETHKQLILKHIKNSGIQGASLSEFRQVLPQLTDPQIRHLVDELRDAGLIIRRGWANTARWLHSEIASM